MNFRKVIIDQLKRFPYFKKETIKQLCTKHNLSSFVLNSYIHKAIKREEIISLKRGLYVTKDFYEKHISDLGYRYFLANIIREPSYISSWTALSYYGMTTDVVKATISVTPKTTRKYSNKAGGFIYHSIKEDLFSDFRLMKSKSGFRFLIASPAKALFDLIYLRTNQFRTQKDNIIKDLRIETNEMSRTEIKKFKILLNKNKVSWKIL